MDCIGALEMNTYTDQQLLNLIDKIGKQMCAASSTRTVAMEKERALLIKEAFKRNLLGYPPKRKYRDW